MHFRNILHFAVFKGDVIMVIMESIYQQTEIITPLGSVITISDDSFLYLLEFVDRKNVAQEIEQFICKTSSVIIEGSTSITELISKELNDYFAGKLQRFTIPIQLMGTPFQNSVWKELQNIPYGQTYSYKQLAKAINSPKGYRAVARANSMNQLAIIIPCHRVINTNGKLGGYAGGLYRKKKLLEHEITYT
jgi:O-6-methylguanine DNA methyltransferase